MLYISIVDLKLSLSFFFSFLPNTALVSKNGYGFSYFGTIHYEPEMKLLLCIASVCIARAGESSV